MQENITREEAPKNGAAKQERQREALDARTVTPPVDVLENADEVLVLADLPGVKADDLNLHLEKDALTLSAKRTSQAFERPVVYKRVFFVPSDLDPERIEAKLDAGVLTLRFPRRQSAKPRTIPVATR